MSPTVLSALENQKNFLRDWGFVKDFDFADWIVRTPLQLAQEQVAARRGLNPPNSNIGDE